MAFKKAIKYNARARVALMGVTGGGKSMTMLKLARALAGPDGKIAAVDTEHGSLSKYADMFVFDVDEPSSYTAEYLLGQLDYAEANGYAVFCVDSLSHFWMGKDGALEFVDGVSKRARDKMDGWKAFRPHERSMVDRFISSPCHIIVTMRVKTAYEDQETDGKKKRVKIGLAPVQREGLEYEFDLVCSMDDENTLIVDKTRCSAYSEERMRTARRPDAEYFRPFIEWLQGEARPKSPAVPVPPSPPAGAATTQAVQGPRPWTNFSGMVSKFTELKEALAAKARVDVYYTVLTEAGVKHCNEFRSGPNALACYRALQARTAEAITAAVIGIPEVKPDA